MRDLDHAMQDRLRLLEADLEVVKKRVQTAISAAVGGDGSPFEGAENSYDYQQLLGAGISGYRSGWVQ